MFRANGFQLGGEAERMVLGLRGDASRNPSALTGHRSTQSLRIVGGAVNRRPAKRTRERKVHEPYHDFFQTPISPPVPRQSRIAGTWQQAQNRNGCRICTPHGCQRRTLRTAPVTSLMTKSRQYPDKAQLSARPAIC